MKYEQFLADVVQALAEVDFMGRTLSRVKAVLSATHDLAEKNGRLEKENAELKGESAALKAQLDGWKGSAEGFQPDAYMKLPLDADGVPIRIGDEMVDICVDEHHVLVDGYRRFPEWGKLGFTVKNKPGIYDPSGYGHKKPEPADSWAKLEEDVEKQSCSYFDQDLPPASCDDCPHGLRQTGRTCWQNARLDMIARAKKLAVVEEEAQR